MPKGYFTKSGYMGRTKIGWILFSTENEYIEYITESQGGMEGEENECT